MLRADPVRNQLVFANAVAIQRRSQGSPPGGPEPRILTVHSADRCVGAALENPPWPLALSDMPGPAAEALGVHLRELGAVIPGTNAPERLGHDFARGYAFSAEAVPNHPPPLPDAGAVDP